MGSKVGLGAVRGLLVDADKRPVLRLLPQMDEVCRGYAIAHLGGDGCSIEDTASQVWLLNATDWIKRQDEIQESLCKDLDSGGFSRVLHEFAMKVAEDFLRDRKKQGQKVSKESWELLHLKRRWLDGEVSDEELKTPRTAYWAAYRAADLAADMVAYWAAYWAASWAAYWATYWETDRVENWATEKKKQVELLVEMLEDSVGIERGNALVS